MENLNNVAAAIITKLKADTALTEWLTARSRQNEIRELQWQGVRFNYPCIRVDVGTINPMGDGSCYTTVGTQAFRIYCYSEKDSSYECSELAYLVKNALENKQLNSDDFSTTRMVATALQRPIRTAQRVWETQIPFTTIISEVS